MNSIHSHRKRIYTVFFFFFFFYIFALRTSRQRNTFGKLIQTCGYLKAETFICVGVFNYRYIILWVGVAFWVHKPRNPNAKCNIEDLANATLTQQDTYIYIYKRILQYRLLNGTFLSKLSIFF